MSCCLNIYCVPFKNSFWGPVGSLTTSARLFVEFTGLYEVCLEWRRSLFILGYIRLSEQVNSLKKMNKSKVKPSKPTIPPHATGNCSSPASRTTPPSKSKSEKDVPYEGIYQNLRFCETITSLMGNTVQVCIPLCRNINFFIICNLVFFLKIQLSNGKIFEGIFSTFSPQLEVVLELVHTVDPNHPDKIDIKSVSREVVFGSQLIVTMSSKDVELDYATKGECCFIVHS